MLLDRIYAGDVIFACARVSFLSLPSVSTLRLGTREGRYVPAKGATYPRRAL